MHSLTGYSVRYFLLTLSAFLTLHSLGPTARTARLHRRTYRHGDLVQPHLTVLCDLRRLVHPAHGVAPDLPTVVHKLGRAGAARTRRCGPDSV